MPLYCLIGIAIWLVLCLAGAVVMVIEIRKAEDEPDQSLAAWAPPEHFDCPTYLIPADMGADDSQEEKPNGG